MGQLIAGKPEFKTMKPYIPKGLNMKHLGLFMNKTFWEADRNQDFAKYEKSGKEIWS